MQLIVVILLEPWELTDETSFGYKHSLTNRKKVEILSPSQPVHQQQIRKQSDFSANKYVFRGIKCTCTNIFRKMEVILRPKIVFSMCCTPDSIIQLSFMG